MLNDFDNLKTSEIIQIYSEIIKQLKKRNIIRTKNLLGDLAEYLAIDFFNKTPNMPNLQAAPAGTQNIDAISRNGERYSIKATTGSITGVFYGIEAPNSLSSEKQKFEYVLILKFTENFELDKIVQLDWETFLKHKRWHKTMNAWNLSVTKALIKDATVMFDKSIKV
jgi:hypothetical protein